MAEGYLLTREDKDKVQEVIDFVRTRRVNTVGRTYESQEDWQAPEVYVARTPPGGIPSLIPAPGSSIKDEPGCVSCNIYRILTDEAAAGTGCGDTLIPVSGLSYRIHNLTPGTIPGDTWVLVSRDKFGHWFAVEAAGAVGFWAQLIGPVKGTGAVGSSGGSISAGTYTVVTTYVVGGNEYTAQGPASYTVPQNGTLTVNSPPSSPGATGWKCYIAGNTGSSFKLQGGTNSIGSNLTLTIIDLSALTTAPKPSYAWVEVVPYAVGTFSVKAGGLSGTTSVNPAYEVGGSPYAYLQESGLFIYVWMRPGYENTSSGAGQEYLFEGGRTSTRDFVTIDKFLTDVTCVGSVLTKFGRYVVMYNGRQWSLGQEQSL